jgi:hypothetical protein
MLRRAASRLSAGLILAIAAIAPAAADVCRSIRAELASISRPPSQRERQVAAQAAYEAQRLRAYMSAIGCDRQPFLFVGPQPPAECRAYRAQVAQLQAQAQAPSSPDEVRRRQLVALLASNGCTGDRGPRRSQPLTAGIFDNGSRRPGELSSIEIDPGPEPELATPRMPAGKPVCVRLCDGYFFPLQQAGQGLAEDGDSQCQALCPGAQTRLYFTQGGIESAVSATGEAYADLDNALRYRKRYDATCSCRRPEAVPGSGLQLMNPEGGAPGSFELVNPDPQDDAPLRGLTPVPGRRTDGALFRTEPRPAPSPPPEIAIENLIPADQGEMRTLRGPGGVNRTVRIIGPPPVSAPSAAGAGAAPGRAPAP